MTRVNFNIYLPDLQFHQSYAVNQSIEWLFAVNEINGIIVNPRMLWKLCYQLWEENICKGGIFWGDDFGSLINFPWGYLCPARKIDFTKNCERHYVYHKRLIFRITSCSYTLYISNKLHWINGRKSLSSSIQPLFKLLIIKIGLDIAQNEEDYSKNNIYVNVS